MRAFGNHRTTRFFVLSGIALGVMVAPALAQAPPAPAPAAAAAPAPAAATPAPSPTPSGWRFEIVPYLWAAGLDGDVKVGRLPTAGVEATFSDLLNVLDFALMGSFVARRDRGGFFVDALYFDLSDSASTPNDVYGDADVGLTEQMYSAAGTYRVNDGGKVPVEILGGLRYVDISGDLELTSGIAAGRKVNGSVNWWDGFVGANIHWEFAEHWALVGYGDIGGGGSKLTWQALAGIDWTFSPHLSGKFGYRYMSIDYDETELLYDVAMAGGYAGLGIRF
jgi:hypothetical protein